MERLNSFCPREGLRATDDTESAKMSRLLAPTFPASSFYIQFSHNVVHRTLSQTHSPQSVFPAEAAFLCPILPIGICPLPWNSTVPFMLISVTFRDTGILPSKY